MLAPVTTALFTAESSTDTDELTADLAAFKMLCVTVVAAVAAAALLAAFPFKVLSTAASVAASAIAATV